MAIHTDPVLAEVWRGEFLEAVHHGSIVITDADGAVRFAAGTVDQPFLPRSAIKPIQAVAMLRHGLDLDGALLALAGASHSGEQFHVDGALAILDGAGLTPDLLQTTPGLPLDPAAGAEWHASGRGREAIVHNCSGKHAAMLRTCLRAGWPLDSYLDARHPLQLAIREELANQTGDDVPEPVVDGCGAPAFAVTAAGLARAMGRIASATEGPERRLADAYREHPEYVSGSTRAERTFHREVPGLICKIGAEATLAVGLTDGTGIVVKIADGNDRGAYPAAVAILTALGLGTDTLSQVDPDPVLGHGQKVGGVKPSGWLTDALAEGEMHP